MTTNRDDAIFEDAMRECMPRRLDARLFGRLTSTLDEACMPVEKADVEMELLLADFRPGSVPGGLMSRLAGLADEAPKVIPMPVPKRGFAIRGYAAAAVIALAGAVAALLTPMGESPNIVADVGSVDRGFDGGQMREFVPAGYARGLSDAHDEGVVWKDNAPHRVLRIVYKDTLTLRNEAGEVVEVEQPRVEYIVVPEKID